MNEAVQIENGDLDPIRTLCSKNHISVYLGCIERPSERGGHSLYCSLVYIDKKGIVQSVHRKLMPTYEERLVWSPGDGHGLKVHKLKKFTVGGLNCWENWMPLARSALYGMGEDLHVAVWPGSVRNTRDISQFIAKESRSFVVSVSGLMRKKDISQSMPHFDLIQSKCNDNITDGGSCLAGPDGKFAIEPVTDKEDLFIAEINHEKVRQERQNFDPSGHYSRPDVTRLHINTERQKILS